MGVVVDTGVFVLWKRRADSLPRRDTRSRFVEAILLQFPILGIDLNVARIHAQLSAELTQKGTSIGYQDLWIAATALNYDCAVMTTNEHEFSRIQDLEIIPIDTN